jgi:thioredoxin reductase (NADPH)
MPKHPDRTTPDVLIVGAGPVGLQAAILAKRAGLRPVVFDRGCIVNAIYNYPTYMTFFTTAERLEIGGHPLVTATGKPTRKEALDYYRKVVQNERLDVRQYTAVEQVTRLGSGFRLETSTASGARQSFEAPVVIVATGYFDTPKQLGIPGEDLPNVSHYSTEAHPFHDRNVVIVGAGSSAADAALDLFRAGARVTMIHRGADFRHSLKYWIRPDLVNRVKEGSITAHMNTTVRCITPQAVLARDSAGQDLVIPAEQTFLLTGYYADPALLRSCGVSCHPDTLAAELDPETFESNVPGLFVIGSAGTGLLTSDVFIENGLVHAGQALARITTLLQ